MSVNSTSPSVLFGGTWEQLENRFLLGAGSSYSAGSTGGEAEHTLTTNEMPSHTHSQSNHTHKLPNSAIVYSSSYSGEIPNGSAKKYGTNTQAQLSTAGATANINNTGGGQAHNNMPPYLAVYIWKRTG